MTHWSEDDRLWNAMAPALSAPERHAIADAEVAAVIKGTELPTGAHVLDLGCGAGLHAVAFASRGFVVTGVDRNGTLLHSAQTRASTAGLAVEFINDDIRTFTRPARYDLVCSLNSSFAYFGDDTNLRILRNIQKCLRDGGTLLLDTLGEAMATYTGDAGIHDIGGSRYSVRRLFDKARGVLQEEWTVETTNVAERYLTEQRIYSVAELISMAHDAGLAAVRVSSSLDATAPYVASSLRLVVFARQ
jgi:2-polyprenyl-3-methyl-5-hydroxy-6-metoxy-1,4-benzoquinol methylase